MQIYENSDIRVCNNAIKNADIKLGLSYVLINGSDSESEWDIPGGEYYLFPVRDSEGNLDPEKSLVFIESSTEFDSGVEFRRLFDKVYQGGRAEKCLRRMVCHQFEMDRNSRNQGIQFRRGDHFIKLSLQEQEELIDLMSATA